MFALGHPEKIVDFAYRAVHEMTVKSKRLIDEFYGRAPQFSYFKGCSTGGRQAVMAAQRFPDDYDGIIAGALANRHIQMHTAGVARSIELARHPEQAIPAAKAEMVNDGGDEQVRHAQGRLPEQPAPVQRSISRRWRARARTRATLPDHAAAEDRGDLLRRPEEQQGRADLLGPGARQSACRRCAARPAHPAAATTRSASGASRTPNYDWQTFDLDRDMPIINKKVGFVDAVDPDLSKFKAHGGKLLLYAGWGDTTSRRRTPFSTTRAS